MIKVGSDPELFVLNEHRKVVPAIGLLGGTKKEPRDIGGGFYVQEDNVLAEFNIPPADTEAGFVEMIWEGIARVKQELPKGYDVLAKPSHMFEDEQLKAQAAKEFGCDPDFCAWTGDENEPPLSPFPTLRSGGGHLLISYNNPTPERNRELVKLCDKYLGVPSVLMDRDRLRKQLYGKAGAYRDKEWGVEYRTLSSFWLTSRTYAAWAYRNMIRALTALENGEKISKNYQVRIIEAINTPDEDLAMALAMEFDLECL
jgi:hypothetical protein